MQKNDKLNSSFMISIILHIVLIGLSIWISITKNSSINIRSDVNTMMVDHVAIIQHYNLQLKQQQKQIHLISTEQQYNQKESGREIKYLQQKQSEKHLDFKKEQKNKIQIIDHAKQVTTNITEKKSIKNNNNQLYNKTKNNIKDSERVHNLFNLLADSKKNLNRNGNFRDISFDVKIKSANHNNSKTNIASSTEISDYARKIQAAIESKFHIDSIFSGEVCKLHIQLSSNGMLLNVISKGGAPDLCQAAITAAKMAIYPKPPSESIYRVFKNAFINFEPK
ncbi:cell envelope integrity protein TolA [Candidatus Profftia sp. (ex Adelges kitamiensis)]|uniref:cell envelope integrity protein TolA n=1 Tax=Candidatus Profftia sp. (ex Adelges kitamiensis) TaxID=2864218 RepID=UPI001CE27781|nr:cell envelope integrity protein TolA [Candidatus Profftia sp. (ex Adelges kitamiensis)]